jgi:hypothetical protein
LILPSRESELLHDYLAQVALLTTKSNWSKQVRQAYKRLVEHRQVTWLQGKEQERSTVPMAIAADQMTWRKWRATKAYGRTA